MCMCVFVCQLCRWNHPEVCAHILHILACRLTHLRQCKKQTSAGWCIDKSGFGVGMGVCQQWVVVCAGPRKPMTWAGVCCWLLADSGCPQASESPRSTLIQLPMVTLDSISSLPQTHHGSSWSPRPCMAPATTPHPFHPSPIAHQPPSTCLLPVPGGCQIGSYLSAFAPAMSTG